MHDQGRARSDTVYWVLELRSGCNKSNRCMDVGPDLNLSALPDLDEDSDGANYVQGLNDNVTGWSDLLSSVGFPREEEVDLQTKTALEECSEVAKVEPVVACKVALVEEDEELLEPILNL
ncbi:hypothetical protein LEMLEM_LOCUS1965 [Lemmus lemmus]